MILLILARLTITKQKPQPAFIRHLDMLTLRSLSIYGEETFVSYSREQTLNVLLGGGSSHLETILLLPQLPSGLTEEYVYRLCTC